MSGKNVTVSKPTIMFKTREGDVEINTDSHQDSAHTQKKRFRVICSVEVEKAGGRVIGETVTVIYSQVFGAWRKVSREVLDGELRGNADLNRLVEKTQNAIRASIAERQRKFSPPDDSWSKDRVLLD